MDRHVRTILVVDGSASILFSLGVLLKKLEYRVVTARSGEEALRTMGRSVPAVVLTEAALPTMSGVALLKQIKESAALQGVPVIMLTSENDPGIITTCTRLGCDAYLIKPAEPEVIYRAIQAASESAPRANIRLRTSLKVMVGDGSALGGASRTEYASAISEGGLFIGTRYPQPRKAVTPLTIFLSGREIMVKAVVIYSCDQGEGPFKEPGMGMEFTQISDADRSAIRHFIREQLMHDVPGPEHVPAVPVSEGPEAAV